MTPQHALEALLHVQRCDSSKLPGPDWARDEFLTPLSLCGLAVVSGALDDAATWEQLCEAVDHGFSLVSAEIISFDQWQEEIETLMEECAPHGY